MSGRPQRLKAAAAVAELTAQVATANKRPAKPPRAERAVEQALTSPSAPPEPEPASTAEPTPPASSSAAAAAMATAAPANILPFQFPSTFGFPYSNAQVAAANTAFLQMQQQAQQQSQPAAAAAAASSTVGRGERGYNSWTREAELTLIALKTNDENRRFSLKSGADGTKFMSGAQRARNWDAVAQAVADAGFNYTRLQCINKWDTLWDKYRMWKRAIATTGSGVTEEDNLWEDFAVLDQLWGSSVEAEMNKGAMQELGLKEQQEVINIDGDSPPRAAAAAAAAASSSRSASSSPASAFSRKRAAPSATHNSKRAREKEEQEKREDARDNRFISAITGMAEMQAARIAEMTAVLAKLVEQKK